MRPRSVFDGLLVAVLGLIVYVRLIGPTFSYTRAEKLKEVLTNLGLEAYLVVGGILAILALGFMFIYMPQRQAKNVSR